MFCKLPNHTTGNYVLPFESAFSLFIDTGGRKREIFLTLIVDFRIVKVCVWLIFGDVGNTV